MRGGKSGSSLRLISNSSLRGSLVIGAAAPPWRVVLTQLLVQLIVLLLSLWLVLVMPTSLGRRGGWGRWWSATAG